MPRASARGAPSGNTSSRIRYSPQGRKYTRSGHSFARLSHVCQPDGPAAGKVSGPNSRPFKPGEGGLSARLPRNLQHNDHSRCIRQSSVAFFHHACLQVISRRVWLCGPTRTRHAAIADSEPWLGVRRILWSGPNRYGDINHEQDADASSPARPYGQHDGLLLFW